MNPWWENITNTFHVTSCLQEYDVSKKSASNIYKNHLQTFQTQLNSVFVRILFVDSAGQSCFTDEECWAQRAYVILTSWSPSCHTIPQMVWCGGIFLPPWGRSGERKKQYVSACIVLGTQQQGIKEELGARGSGLTSQYLVWDIA